MKITIERKSFVDALTIGSQMSGKARGLSVLENCKITCKNNTATISSYDSEVAITKRTEIESHDEDIVFCIEPKALLAILRSLKDEQVDLILEDTKCEIVHAKGKQTLPYESAEDFPTPTIDKDMKRFELPSLPIFNFLKEAKNFVGVSTLYPQLMGVYIYVNNEEFGVASTNTEILYHNNEKREGLSEDEIGASISVKSIDALLPMINETDIVSIMFGERNVVFKTQDSMLIATKSEQAYPNFRRIIPQNHEMTMEVDKDDFLDAVKRAMLTANEKTCLLKLGISSIMVSIESEDIMFAKKTHEECFCTCDGSNMNVALKGTYLLNMINSIESDKVVIKLIAHNRPIIYNDLLNSNKVLLQMPCQL